MHSFTSFMFLEMASVTFKIPLLMFSTHDRFMIVKIDEIMKKMPTQSIAINESSLKTLQIMVKNTPKK